MAKQEEAVRNIPVLKCDKSPLNPRGTLDPKALAELVKSMSEGQLHQPIVVRPKGDRFEVLIGFRRWSAAKHLRWSTIPAIVRDLADQEAAVAILAEQEEREDLNPIELARGLEALVTVQGMKTEEAAGMVGKSEAWFNRQRSLLRLVDSARDALASRKLSVDTGALILRIADLKTQAQAVKDVLALHGGSEASLRASKELLERRYLSNPETVTRKGRKAPAAAVDAAISACADRAEKDPAGAWGVALMAMVERAHAADVLAVAKDRGLVGGKVASPEKALQAIRGHAQRAPEPKLRALVVALALRGASRSAKDGYAPALKLACTSYGVALE